MTQVSGLGAVPRTAIPFALPIPFPMETSGRHVQVNSPMCGACTAWETRGKGQPWAALRWTVGRSCSSCHRLIPQEEKRSHPSLAFLPPGTKTQRAALPEETCLIAPLNLSAFPLRSYLSSAMTTVLKKNRIQDNLRVQNAKKLENVKSEKSSSQILLCCSQTAKLFLSSQCCL